MDFDCFVFPGWSPRIRPAGTRRKWMDEAPEGFAYRCLPLQIANGHGWEILSPCGFSARWNGGPAADDVSIWPDPGTATHDAPVALFGLGTFTIHIQGIFRTPPQWNLFVSGPMNAVKDGVGPLAGIIETDWSPYTFTMNWQLTRPGVTVRFEENEPIAFIMPMPRGAAEAMNPRLRDIDEAPELKEAFEAWSVSRNEFQAEVAANPPRDPKDKWQKSYYRGLVPGAQCPTEGHQTKLNVKPFGGKSMKDRARRSET